MFNIKYIGYFFLISIFITIVSLLVSFTLPILALSPDFIRQEVFDSNLDFIDEKGNLLAKTNSICVKNYSNPSGISSVSYMSDGKNFIFYNLVRRFF